uniref:Hflx-type G domain-containing protein n=1 Tax=Clastoptera arizonana TaxID=38151 RepID=A0A1B6CJ09_9HEMI
MIASIRPLKRIFNCVLRPFVSKITKVNHNKNYSSIYYGHFYKQKIVNLKYNKNFSKTSYYLKDISFDQEDPDSTNGNDEESFYEFANRTFRIPENGHNVFIIQPYIKWGPLKKTKTTPQLQLEEAVTLIKTLPRWKVLDSKIISLMSLDKKTLFGKGNLELIHEIIKANDQISAIFVSINILKPSQHRVLEDLFRVPVYDRYTIVMLIFKEHAITKEAKLQVSMAEIPYLYSRLKNVHEGATDRLGGGASAIGGDGETFIEVKRRLLTTREQKLKEAIKKLRGHREIIRKKRKKLEIPTVAVVGYTNAGKTSLIKALTGEKTLEPKDQLFATLDVTVHSGLLPSNLEVLYVDTIGFISDIPTGLIESFIATLEDAMIADLIIHVLDVSHPDAISQSEHVINTLKSLNLQESLFDNIIHVGNKADMLKTPLDDSLAKFKNLLVSATNGLGLKELKYKVENSVIKSTGRITMKIRIKNGGPELRWLYKESTVVNVEVDNDNTQFIYVNVIITESSLNKFKHLFIKLKNSSKSTY